MKEQTISQEGIHQLALKGLFIRGFINKYSHNERDRAQIHIISGLGACYNYVEYQYTYAQLQNGSDFVAHLERKVFTPQEHIDVFEVVKILGNLDGIELYDNLSPEVIITKFNVHPQNIIPACKQLPLTDLAVITHLARFQGMIGQSRDPKIFDGALEQVYARLGALISQQLRKWSQMVG